MTGSKERKMRGTNKITELTDIEVSAVALVGSPAIGIPFAIIKSETIPDEPVVVPEAPPVEAIATEPAPSAVDAEATTVTREEIVKMFADQQAAIVKALGPQPANMNPFPDGGQPDPQKELVVKSIKNLVAASNEMIKEQRADLAVVAKYHGVDGPAITDDEEDGSSPAMVALEKKIDAVVSAMNVIAAKFQEQAAPAPVVAPAEKPAAAKTVKKDESEDPIVVSRLEKMDKAIALAAWTLVQASGKDPGDKPV